MVDQKQAIRMQEKICRSKVCIIGMGGTGSHLALSMVSIGVENLIIVDFDYVEMSNTSRQVLYDENDVGKLKTEVAAKKLIQYNSKANIISHNIQINSTEDMEFIKSHRDIDLLILCADTPRGEIQYIVDDVAGKYGIQWFCYGPFKHSQILVGPLIVPQMTRSYSELLPVHKTFNDENIEVINNRFVASICDPYNGFASQFAAIEAFKILSGYNGLIN